MITMQPGVTLRCTARLFKGHRYAIATALRLVAVVRFQRPTATRPHGGICYNEWLDRMLANGIAGMRLWTYHDSDFEIDEPRLSVDWTKGRYWNITDSRFMYREALPALQELVGETSFLWFCTKSPNTFNTANYKPNRIEWEIDIPIDGVLAFIHSPFWEAIVRPAKGCNWRELLPALRLMQSTPESVRDSDVDALVKAPLPAGCVIQKRRVPTDEENRERRPRSFAESRQ